MVNGTSTLPPCAPPSTLLARVLCCLPRLLQLLKVVDLQRSHWAEVCSGFIAVLRSLAPMPVLTDSTGTASSSPAADGAAPARPVDHTLLGREMLAQWLQHRVDWFLRTLAGLLPAIDDAANLQSLLQQCTYAARRAARLGADYTHALGPLFHARVEALIVDKFAVVAAQFRADVRGWQWSYKMGYEPRGDAAAAGAAAAPAAPVPASASGDPLATAASTPAAAALAPPMLPQELLRVAPLADMCNGLVSAVNAVRPCLPVAAVPCLLRELRQTITAAVESLEAATTADASPVMLLQAASARAAAAAASRGGGAPVGVSDEDMLAIRRFVTLCTYLNKHLLPFAEQVGIMVAAGAEITESTMPAARADGATSAATPTPGAAVSPATATPALAFAAAVVSPTFRELEARVRETLASITGKIRAATA